MRSRFKVLEIETSKHCKIQFQIYREDSDPWMLNYRITKETTKTDKLVKTNKLIIYKEMLKTSRKTFMRDNKKALKYMMTYRM